MRTALAFTALALLSACTDVLDLVRAGQQYELRSINGQPVPWPSPSGNGGYIGAGWVKIDDDSLAERHEQTDRSEWTLSGRYQFKLGMFIIDYGPGWQPGMFGPMQRVDTFRVSGDELVLREGAIHRAQRQYGAPLRAPLKAQPLCAVGLR